MGKKESVRVDEEVEGKCGFVIGGVIGGDWDVVVDRCD